MQTHHLMSNASLLILVQNNDVGVLDFDEVFYGSCKLWIYRHLITRIHSSPANGVRNVVRQPGDANMNGHGLIALGYNPSFE